MSDFFRVKHPVFGHFSTRKPDVWGGEVTDDDATDVNGKPLKAKPKTSVAAKAAEKKNTPTPGAEPAAKSQEAPA